MVVPSLVVEVVQLVSLMWSVVDQSEYFCCVQMVGMVTMNAHIYKMLVCSVLEVRSLFLYEYFVPSMYTPSC